MYQNGDTGARADRFAIKDSTFMSMPIKVPTLEEQHKLAFAFQKLDRTITLHVQKLSLLKRVKQTLLQKMFIWTKYAIIVKEKRVLLAQDSLTDGPLQRRWQY